MDRAKILFDPENGVENGVENRLFGRSYAAPFLFLLRFARSSSVRCGVRAMASTQTIPGGGMKDHGSKTKGGFSPFEESQCARFLVVGGTFGDAIKYLRLTVGVVHDTLE